MIDFIKSFFHRQFMFNNAAACNNFRRSQQTRWDDVCM